MMAKNKLVKIAEEEYDLLKIYKRDAQEIMKFLAINHHNIYMDICWSKLRKIEDRVVRLPENKFASREQHYSVKLKGSV